MSGREYGQLGFEQSRESYELAGNQESFWRNSSATGFYANETEYRGHVLRPDENPCKLVKRRGARESAAMIVT